MNEGKKFKRVVVFLSVLFILYCIALGLLVSHDMNVLKRNYDTQLMKAGINASSVNELNGYISYDRYFCIYTKDKTLDEIMSTTLHELLHYMSFEEKQHFMGNQYNVSS